MHQLLHLLLLLRHLLLVRLQLRLLLVDLAHHRLQARVVARRLRVQLLHARLVHAVHARVRVVEQRDHRVDRHQLRLDLVHTHLRRLPVALRAAHDLRALRVHLALQRLRAIRDLLRLRVVLHRDRRGLRRLALHQLVLQTVDVHVHFLDVLAHFALSLVQTHHLAAQLVRNLHQLLAGTHQSVLRSRGGSGRSGSGSRGSSRSSGRSSYGSILVIQSYAPHCSCPYSIRDGRNHLREHIASLSRSVAHVPVHHLISTHLREHIASLSRSTVHVPVRHTTTRVLTRTYRLPEPERCSCHYSISQPQNLLREHVTSLLSGSGSRGSSLCRCGSSGSGGSGSFLFLLFLLLSKKTHIDKPKL